NDPDQAKLKRPHTCETCGLTCRSLSNLKAHQKTLGDDDPSKHRTECDICGKIMNGDNLAKHKKTHLDDNDPEQAKLKRPHSCDSCSGVFQSARKLKLHMSVHT
ncbi:hypothetical protein PENTCL1PPCAC_12738, partial [Pristionchus entomophagus]